MFLWLNTRIKQIRCLNKIFEDENRIIKSKLCTRVYKVFTVQSAIDVTSRHETFFQFKEKTHKRRVPLVTTYHPDLMKLSIIPRNDLSICSLTIECQTSSKVQQRMRLNAQGTLAHSNENKTKQPIVLLTFKTCSDLLSFCCPNKYFIGFFLFLLFVGVVSVL